MALRRWFVLCFVRVLRELSVSRDQIDVYKIFVCIYDQSFFVTQPLVILDQLSSKRAAVWLSPQESSRTSWHSRALGVRTSSQSCATPHWPYKFQPHKYKVRRSVTAPMWYLREQRLARWSEWLLKGGLNVYPPHETVITSDSASTRWGRLRSTSVPWPNLPLPPQPHV